MLRNNNKTEDEQEEADLSFDLAIIDIIHTEKIFSHKIKDCMASQQCL